MSTVFAVDLELWVREHFALVALLVLILVALLVVRLVVKTLTRVIALAVICAMALFVSAERQEFQRCGTTCECDLVGAHVDMPFCRREFPS